MFSKEIRWRPCARALAVFASVIGSVVGSNAIIFAQAQGTSSTSDPQQGVYVPDSAIATDKFELGKRMERLKEWHKSADVYQEILEKYQDRVVATLLNDRGQPMRYASVSVAVQEQLSKWPEEGLNVYRSKYEPVASGILEQAKRDSIESLHKVFWLYFATDSAKTAGQRLMDYYLENGEFSAAGLIGDRLLNLHPNLIAERPSVLFRTATAYHLAGNEASAKKRLDELKKNHVNEIGTVGGKDGNLAAALEAQLAEKAPVAVTRTASSWRTANGDETRQGVATGQPVRRQRLRQGEPGVGAGAGHHGQVELSRRRERRHPLDRDQRSTVDVAEHVGRSAGAPGHERHRQDRQRHRQGHEQQRRHQGGPGLPGHAVLDPSMAG